MKINGINKFFLMVIIISAFTVCSGCILPFGVFTPGRSGDRMPEEAVGTWQTGTVSGIVYKDQSTGSYSDPSGTQVMYKITADGRYEYSALMSQSMYNCNTKLFMYKVGYIKLNKGTLTFVPTKGKFTSQDNCNPRFNYEKPADLTRETFQWSIEKDEYGMKICLQNSSGNTCAYKRE